MDNKGLEVFLAIATAKNFIKAAGILNLTQSTVSHRLKELEDDMGTRLVKRHQGKKEVSLTQAGEHLLPLALRWRQLNEEIDGVKSLPPAKISLSIGGLDSVKNHILLPFMKEFRMRNPQIHLNLYTGSSTYMYELIAKRKVDVAFVQFDVRSALAQSETFCREEMAVLSRKGTYHEFSNRTLSPEDELAINWGANFCRWHDAGWGPLHRPGTLCDTLFELRGLLQGKKDWAFIPMSSAKWFLRDETLCINHFPSPPPLREILMIKSLHPDVQNARARISFESILKEKSLRERVSDVTFVDPETQQ